MSKETDKPQENINAGSLLLGILFAAFVAGICIGDKVEISEIHEAERLCENNSGVVKLVSYLNNVDVYCNNGARFTFQSASIRNAK